MPSTVSTFALVAIVIFAVAQPVDSRSLATIEETEYHHNSCMNGVAITKSQEVFFMFSELKTGTTVFDWIVRKLIEKVAERISLCNNETALANNVDPSTMPRTNVSENFHQVSIEYEDKRLLFSRQYKHSSIWPHTIDRDAIETTGRDCIAQGLSARSPECIAKLPNLSHLKRVDKVPIVVTMRDPIAASVSYMYYYFKNTTTDTLNDMMFGIGGCKEMITWISLRYTITEIVRSYGYNLELFYYEDLRANPALFIYRIARFLGLIVDTEIVNQVVESTSLEATKALQEEVNEEDNFVPNRKIKKRMQKHWPGLADSRINTRKVRNGEVRGYLNELKPETLKYCLEFEEENLPPELYFRYMSFFIYGIQNKSKARVEGGEG